MDTINGSLQRLQTDSDEGYINITSLPAGKYTVKVYDSKIDYLSHKRPAYVYDKMLHISSSVTAVPSNAVSTSSIGKYNSCSIMLESKLINISFRILLCTPFIEYDPCH